MSRADREPWEPPGVSRPVALSRQEERLRPLYSRMLGLRHVNPGGLLCFVFFEGSLMLAVLLALAELVSWWAIIVLPLSVALLVKINDEVAAAVTRSAARVPELERERFRRQLTPAIGRATVPVISRAAVPAGSRRALGAAGGTTVTGTAVVPYRRAPGPADWSTAGSSRPLPPGRATPDVLRVPSGAQRALPAGPSGSGRSASGPGGMFTPPVGPASAPVNAHPVDPSEHRPAVGWPGGLDPVDSPEQRTRQTGSRRYGARRSRD